MKKNYTLVQDPLLADVPIFDNYKVLEPVLIYAKLKEGNMGAIYKGRHLRLNIDVAVKIMMLPAQVESDARATFTNRFIREAQTAAGIIHQNLIHVFDVKAQHGINYLIMEFVDGETVNERLKRMGKLSEYQAFEIVKEAAEGLAEAHARGIVHRDIKSDNIMISREGNVKVMDLGLAKAFDNRQNQAMEKTVVGMIMGTPFFMSPEQTYSSDVGPKSDVWSLGVTLFNLLSNKLPFKGKNIEDLIYKIRESPLPNFKQQIPGLADDSYKILSKSLNKDKEKRYTDCKAMGKAIFSHVERLQNRMSDSADSFREIDIPVTKKAVPPEQNTLLKVSKLLKINEMADSAAPKMSDTQPTEKTPEKDGGTAAKDDKQYDSLQKKISSLHSRINDPQFIKYAKTNAKERLHRLLKQATTAINNENFNETGSHIMSASQLLLSEEAKVKARIKNKPFITLNIIIAVIVIVIPAILYIAYELFYMLKDFFSP
ncbi:MAG: serine/threonine-protein kinase [Thermodesulfobacteriota bacterium]|nr:serine/threonine-protein kinase [Thermodesulfobacteriota bacterium]